MLTDRKIKAAKPADKKYKLYDTHGLFLLVRESGSKSFFVRYTLSGRRREASLGKYPALSLKSARLLAAEYQSIVAQGNDPRIVKKQIQLVDDTSFKTVAGEWLTKGKTNVSDDHIARIGSRLKNHVYPYIGHKCVKQLRTPDIKEVLDTIIDAKKFETAERCRGYISEVLCYAIMSGLCEFDVTTPLRGYVKKPPVKHRPALIELRDVASMLQKIWDYSGTVRVRYGLRLSAYSMLRPVEVRTAEWSEINWDRQLWEIPAEKMKMRRPHIVPLTTQIADVLKAMQPFTGDCRYIFAQPPRDQPMSENAINSALKRMGYKGEQTAHGFRGTASTLLYEQNYHGDHIEMQLAHVEKKETKAAYNHARYLKQRRQMLQDYCDFLDGLRLGTVDTNEIE
ncbi:MAG: integrase [Gammaproteobacteria bacterium]|nr:MAG: integrase [Gammaproteobacteria bacterium]